MKVHTRALFGPFAAALFFMCVAGLPFLIPGYNQVIQTVSEIGQVGSPARLPFTLTLCAVGLCTIVFASGLWSLARQIDRSCIPAFLTGCFALSTIGTSVFAYPHPLHNVFGESELIGYLAPIALLICWRSQSLAQPIVRFSTVMAVVLWLVIAANLLTIFRPPVIWPIIKPVFGLLQRSLFAAWFIWCAGVGLILSRITKADRVEVAGLKLGSRGRYVAD